MNKTPPKSHIPPENTGAFTVPEAAHYLRISRSNVFRLFASGELKRTRVGGRTLVRRIDADALLAASVEKDGKNG